MEVSKNFSNTYLYGMGSYEKKIFEFIMKSEVIDKNSDAFSDIVYEVKKRQVSSSLVKVLMSKNIVLLKSDVPLPKAFKVFAAKDIKSGDKKLKVFIDADVIKMVDGKYVCHNIDILIAYLVSALNTMIYYVDPKRLLMKNEIIKDGAYCFASLFTYIVDYLYKITATSSIKDKCLYLSSLYYQVNLLGKDVDGSSKSVSRQISGLSEREEEILFLQLDKEKAFLNINFFVQEVAKILKISKLTLDVFLEKWLYLYGTGTHFSLELYPCFATMMTNVYVGCYLNNQKTIEKIVGNKLVSFTTCILKVGAESV